MKLLDGIDLERRLLVLAPSGKEGELARSIFAGAGVESTVCPDAGDLVREARDGVGAVLVAEEALSQEEGQPLAELIVRQPRWSLHAVDPTDFFYLVQVARVTAAGQGWRRRRPELIRAHYPEWRDISPMQQNASGWRTGRRRLPYAGVA